MISCLKLLKTGFVLFSTSLLLPAADLKSAAEVLDRYVRVTGGQAVWRAQRFERDDIEGRSLDDNTLVLRATVLTSRLGNTLSQVHVPQEGLEGVYGGVAWADSEFSGVRIKRDAEREEAIREAHMLEEGDWRTLYPRARLAAVEDIEGARCYRIDLDAITTEWFDVGTGLLVRRRSSELSPEGATAVGFTVEQYATLNGLAQPSRMLAWRGDFQYRLTILDRSYNKPELLAWPSEVAQYVADDRAGKALPNAEEVIERHIYESGGEEAYSSLRTQHITGRIAFLATNSEAPIETWAAGQGKYYESIDVPGLGKQEEGSDGFISWRRSPAVGPRIKPRNASPGVTITLDAAQVIAWRLLTKQVRTEAAEQIDGRDCWRVRIVPRGSNEVFLRWYDRRTGLLYRSQIALATEMGELPFVETFEDYRDSAGLKWPAKIRMRSSGEDLVFTAEQIRLNEPVDDAIFNLPPEVREMACASAEAPANGCARPADGGQPSQ